MSKTPELTDHQSVSHDEHRPHGRFHVRLWIVSLTFFIGGTACGIFIVLKAEDAMIAAGFEAYAFVAGLIMWVIAVIFQPNEGAGARRGGGCLLGFLLLVASCLVFGWTSLIFK